MNDVAILAASVNASMTTAEQFLFWIVAPIVVLAAGALLISKRAVVTACSVMVTMVGLAFLYVGLDAPFLGVVQVVVYTGAIMMLFVFVLMLVGVDISDSFVETIRGQRWIGVMLGAGLLAVLVAAALRATLPTFKGPDNFNLNLLDRYEAGWSEASAAYQTVSEYSNPTGVATILFRDYPFTLVVTGCLLIIAAMGAVVLTHRDRLTKSIRQGDLAALRIKHGVQVTPPPSPGVYARHNAADVPAVDPDGRIIETSVASVLRMRGQMARLTGVAQDLLPGDVPPAHRAIGAPELPEVPDGAPAAGDGSEPDSPPPAEPEGGEAK
ncbi:MAG: NADH-quinone oxidoreductase subunit J [Bifidobacteriaceae bacterium]|jgi:NADH-quinone oxidoreductase subunit J|nr:NADH-quinone oxidoreductase subunit J [Bifidobacteriaceae bacterium]